MNYLLKKGLTRFIHFFLGLDVLLHLAEFGLAVYEGAFWTSVLTGFHALIFIIAVYLLNMEYKHYHGGEE